MKLSTYTQNVHKNKLDIRLIRNATLIVNYGGHKILVDPMFSPKGARGSILGKAASPMVDLPMSIDMITRDVDLILLTHSHLDHFDGYASNALNKSIKFVVQPVDEELIVKEGFKNIEILEDKVDWDGITIIRTNAQHGTGRVLKEMGIGSGFILQSINLPTVYIVGDTVWTQEIYQNIAKYEPDYIVVNSGGAAMPGFEATPILMDAAQTMSLIQESGKAKVIAVHMDAIDHCHTTRLVLKQKAKELAISSDKLLVPDDGKLVDL